MVFFIGLQHRNNKTKQQQKKEDSFKKESFLISLFNSSSSELNLLNRPFVRFYDIKTNYTQTLENKNLKKLVLIMIHRMTHSMNDLWSS